MSTMLHDHKYDFNQLLAARNRIGGDSTSQSTDEFASVTVLLRFVATLALFVGLNLVALADLEAQISQAARGQLRGDVQRVIDELNEDGLPDLETKILETNRAYSELEGYLRTVADDENRAGWLNYVGYDQLRKAIAADASPGELGRAARDLYWRLARNIPGLERQAVVKVRESAEDLFQAALFSNREAAVQVLEKQLSRIAEILEESGEVLSPDDAASLNLLLHSVDSSGLAPDLSRRIKVYLGQPNVRVSIGSRLVARIVNRPVFEANPSDECILGTRVISQTVLNGVVTARLIPDHSVARIQLLMSAQFNSNGVGYNRSVRVLNRGFGHVTATQDLTIDPDGLQVQRVHAQANLDSQILGVQHPLRIVRRIAAKKAAQQKPQANRIGEARLAARIEAEFGEQSSSQISGGNLLPRSAVMDVLTRLDISQPTKHWSTTSEYVQIQLTVANREQITSSVAPPPVQPGYDVVIQFHETAIDNPTTSILASRILGDRDIKDFIADLIPQGISVPGLSALDVLRSNNEVEAVAELLPVSDDRFEITFSSTRPIIFEARDGKIRVGIRGTRFERGQDVLNRATEISAAYKPVRKPDGKIRLEREDNVRVETAASRSGRLSISDRAIVTALQSRFETVFPETLLDLPFDFAQPKIMSSTPKPLEIQEIRSDRGWLTLYVR